MEKRERDIDTEKIAFIVLSLIYVQCNFTQT